jgi:hypothetical protein
VIVPDLAGLHPGLYHQGLAGEEKGSGLHSSLVDSLFQRLDLFIYPAIPFHSLLDSSAGMADAGFTYPEIDSDLFQS